MENQQDELLSEREQLLAAIDKSVERWTWDRYQRMEKQLLPRLNKEIDKRIERWTWDRYQRIEKQLLPRVTEDIDKISEKWTWNRYLRIEGLIWNLLFEIRPEMMRDSLGVSSVYDFDFYLRNRYGSVHSAIAILRLVFQWLPHKSIVDFGCGIGSWLWVASALGSQEILGLDGPWVPKSMLMIPVGDFRPTDLQESVTLERKFDLAMSLEVAEHLRPESADTIVASLCRASYIILFSAAHPGQGGDDHINEQPREYWEEKFGAHGYKSILIWNYISEAKGKAEKWYQDNLVLFVHDGKFEEIMGRLSKADGEVEG